MIDSKDNTKFWLGLEKLVKDSEIIIDRPRGSTHRKYPNLIYEVDYGYLKGTKSMDNSGIDVWIGSDKEERIDAIICIIDLFKKDSEIKILIGCTENEKEKIYQFHNNSQYMKGIMIRR